MVILIKFGFERLENILGKGENAVYQHFLLFPKCFQMLPSSGLMKSRVCVVRGLNRINNLPTGKGDL